MLKRVIACGLMVMLVGLVSARRVTPQTPDPVATKSICWASFFSGPYEPDPDLDLPENPTIDQQIAAGKQQLLRLGQEDQTLDRDQEFSSYMKEIVAQLLAASDVKPPYAIEVPVSTTPVLNAYAQAGGQIVFYSEIIEQADTEAQMVAIVSHEMSHELHNDFAFFWTAAKKQQDSYGSGGLLEQSRAIEQRADFEGARIMYNAGWDPKAQIEMMTRIAKSSRMAREGHRVFYSTHPDDPDRIAADEKEIAKLPPRAGLIEDSSKFQELKKKL
jgi:predicted Zn-dependent protease